MKKILTISFLFIVVLYFFQLFRVARNYSQSFGFGDENAHIAGGYFLLKGYKAYKDFSGNHQPLVYIFPALVQKFAPANSLFLLIGRERLAIYFYSIIWNIIYLLVFGKFVFFFTLLFEVTKYVMLGNKVLGEVLAMYPFVILFGLVIKKTIFNKKLKNLEVTLFSLCTFLTWFSLFPLWPSVLILNVLLLVFHLKEKKKILWQIAPFLILTAILFLFIPFNYYFIDTIYDNFTYVIPKMNSAPSKLDYLKMIFLPFISLNINPNFIQIICGILLAFYGLMLYFVKTIKKIFPMSIIILALVLANNRVFKIEFGEFHLLPWLAVYFFIPIVFFSLFFSSKTKFKLSNKLSSLILFIFIGLAIWLNFLIRTPYYGKILIDLKNNLATENYINYSKAVKYGLAMKSIKSKGDRMFGMANNTLAFWVADLDLGVPPLESMRWQYELPRYNKELFNMFKNNPPEFILLDDQDPLEKKDKVSKYILDEINSYYVNLYHQGKPSELYFLKTKFPKITDKQWSNLKYYLFDKPDLSTK
ncbi:MAG: hypothetical protein M1326_00120 [Cyanobacteria bacterium]|nr:hypothetical protein [Cyanobacteriota bacterium]